MDFSQLYVPATQGMTDEQAYEWWKPQHVGGPGPKLALIIIAIFSGKTHDELMQLACAKDEKQMKRFVKPLIEAGLVEIRKPASSAIN